MASSATFATAGEDAADDAARQCEEGTVFELTRDVGAGVWEAGMASGSVKDAEETTRQCAEQGTSRDAARTPPAGRSQAGTDGLMNTV